MANWQVPKFSLNNCAQSPKKTFMCPKFHTNAVLKYTKCHISTNLSSFLKQYLLYCQKYLPLLQHIADSLKKIDLVETLVGSKVTGCLCLILLGCTNSCLSFIRLPDCHPMSCSTYCVYDSCCAAQSIFNAQL